MAQRWHYQRNGQEHGPVTTADLRLLADSERLKPTDMVRQEGTPKWLPAGSVKGLFYTGVGRRPERASGGGGVIAVVVIGLILLLLAGGGAGAYYYWHGFGGGAPVAAPNPPPSTEPPPVVDTSDKMPQPFDPPPPDDPSGGGQGVGGEHRERTFFRYEKGYFKNVGEKQWDEKYGKDTFHYVEKDRKPAYIDLFDPTREITVRIHGDHFDIKAGNVFKKQFDGHWEAP